MLKLAALILFVPAIVHADDKPKPPADVKATVDAIKGNWTFDATVTAPNAKPQKLVTKFNCKPVASGNAVMCDASSPGWEANFLIGYDPYSKVVRFFQITSQYEIRDHTCKWKGKDLECAAQKGGTGPGADEVSDEIKMHFDNNACTFTSTTKGKAGTTVFEGKGKR